MNLSTKFLYTMVLLFLLGTSPSQAQTIETVYPASICDTVNLLDDNSQNSHVDKSATFILGFGFNLPTVVFCPITRMAPGRDDRVRIEIYLTRFLSTINTLEDVSCRFVHTAQNGIGGESIVDFRPDEPGTADEQIVLVGDFSTSVPGGSFGIRCEFESASEITLYTIRVQEFQGGGRGGRP